MDLLHCKIILTKPFLLFPIHRPISIPTPYQHPHPCPTPTHIEHIMQELDQFIWYIYPGFVLCIPTIQRSWFSPMLFSNKVPNEDDSACTFMSVYLMLYVMIPWYVLSVARWTSPWWRLFCNCCLMIIIFHFFGWYMSMAKSNCIQ